MNIILDKDGQTIEYKTGSALYLLWNFIPLGGIITLVLMITRKQFRGILLNEIVYSILFILVYMAMMLLTLTTNSSLIGLLMLVVMLGFAIIGIFMYVFYVLNANYYSIKQRLVEGYTVQNMDIIEVQMAVQKAESLKKPFWQITKF